MDAIRNPFAPGAGTQPPELTGRDQLLEQGRVAVARGLAGRAAKSFIAVGLRGVGKTVLLNRLVETARAVGSRTCFIEVREDRPFTVLLAAQLRAIVLELDRMGAVNEGAKRAVRVLRSFLGAISVKLGELEVGLSVSPEEGTADSGQLDVDLPLLFQAIGEAARARGTGLTLFIDELQYLSRDELSALIMAIHRTAQLGLPIVLIGAGLPQIVGLSGESKSYAERLFDFPPLGPLSRADAIRALAGPAAAEGVVFAAEALDEIVRVTLGYPYFLQEWGYEIWNMAARSPITQEDAVAAGPAVLRKLDSGFFRVRYDRMTPSERGYLRAMAQLGPGPHRSGDIADLLGMKVTSVGPLRSRLIRKGMVYAPAHGDTAFTVPLFDQFMQRQMPHWTAEPGGQREEDA